MTNSWHGISPASCYLVAVLESPHQAWRAWALLWGWAQPPTGQGEGAYPQDLETPAGTPQVITAACHHSKAKKPFFIHVTHGVLLEAW